MAYPRECQLSGSGQLLAPQSLPRTTSIAKQFVKAGSPILDSRRPHPNARLQTKPPERLVGRREVQNALRRAVADVSGLRQSRPARPASREPPFGVDVRLSDL